MEHGMVAAANERMTLVSRTNRHGLNSVCFKHALRGFSLIEVMCAILILGIALVGLTEGITTALSSTKESELQTAAALLAAGQIETLRADGFISEGESEGEGDGDLGLYKWRQTVSRSEIDGLFEVNVAVEHSKTGAVIYELKTLLFDPPLTETDREQQRKDKKKERRGG
jgi:prepilin-type N-terminal cleavage/methylation domain-containing protein